MNLPCVYNIEELTAERHEAEWTGGTGQYWERLVVESLNYEPVRRLLH